MRGRGLRRGELVGYGGQCTFAGNHHLGVAAVADGARDALVETRDEVAPAAALAPVARAAEVPHCDALADSPLRHSGANRINLADDFMAGNARIADAREAALHREDIRVTDAAGLHP
jgi:hypothetical protein